MTKQIDLEAAPRTRYGDIARSRPSWLPSRRGPGSFRDAFIRHPIARKLPLSFSPEHLRQDLDRIPGDWWEPHESAYHDGGWESVSLWAPNGDRRQQRSRGGAFQATDALRLCPYFHAVLDTFPGKRHRVRLMRLRAGSRILRHSDPIHTISAALTRVHVPIVTSRDVWFRVNGVRLLLMAGDAWTVDVRFRHEVENRSALHRVHLVIDLLPDAAFQTLSDCAVIPARGLLLGYFMRHSLPASLRRWGKVGN